MTNHETPPENTEHPGDLPRHTTPTWEVELLISGVAVFAMLQLPGWLDSQLFTLRPRFDLQWAEPLLFTYIYLKSAAILLALTFALHLALRAYWIALVGVHSIHPDGVRWDTLRMGPLEREQQKRHFGTAAGSIDRADNRATIVFALGVILAVRLLLMSLLVLALFTLVESAVSLAGVPLDGGTLFLACGVLILVPNMLAKRIDARFGQRLREGGLPRRGLALVLRFYILIGLGGRSQTMAVLASHRGERRMNLIVLGVFIALTTGVATDATLQKAPGALGNYGLFPGDASPARVIDSSHYDDQRDPLHDPLTPYIQSDLASGPYLRLVVPYRPGNDAPSLRKSCPAAARTREDAARDDALLACLDRLHAVSLDGKPLDTLRYAAGSDPRTRRPALVAMIDIRALPPGEHVLRVQDTVAKRGGGRSVANTDVIPFWH